MLLSENMPLPVSEDTDHPPILSFKKKMSFHFHSMSLIALAERVPEIIAYESNAPSTRIERCKQRLKKPDGRIQEVSVVSETTTTVDCYDIPQSVLDGGNSDFWTFYNQTFG
jgi:hypothetical protein